MAQQEAAVSLNEMLVEQEIFDNLKASIEGDTEKSIGIVKFGMGFCMIERKIP